MKVQTIQKICKREKIQNLNQNMINRRPVTIITILSFGTPLLRQYGIKDQITSFVENYLLSKKQDVVIDGYTLLNSPHGKSSQE